MNKYLAIPAIALVFSCSEGSKNVLVENPDVNTALPTQAELTANYTAAVSPAEITADVQTITENADPTMFSKALESMPSTGGSMGMAKVAVATCSSTDIDTSYVDEEGNSVKMTSKSTKDGKAFEFCMDPEKYQGEDAFAQMMMDMMTSFDGVKTTIDETVTGTDFVAGSSLVWDIDMQLEGDSLVGMDYALEGTSYIKIAAPKKFSMYMDFDINMASTMAGMDEASEVITGSMTLYFMDGRYQCSMDLGSTTAQECELKHNGEVVGVLKSNGEGFDLITE